MPPKLKKTEVSKISKLSTKGLNTKQETVGTKNNYGIFILNIQDDGAQSILKHFIEKAKTQKRRVVVPIVLAEVEEEISLQRATKRASNKNQAEGEEDFLSYQANPGEIMENVQGKIAKCIADNDALLKELNTPRKLDILEHWRSSAPEMTPGKGGKKAKDVKIVKTLKETREKVVKAKDGKGKAGKGKGGKQDEPKQDEACKLGPIPKIEMNEKFSSTFNASNKDNKPPTKYVEDQPMDGLLLYIVIIGTVFSDFCLNLLRENYALSAVVTIIPKTKIDVDCDDEPFQSLTEELSHYNDTKAVALGNISLPTMTKCMASEAQEMIYNQLSWLFYDIETARRQHKNFLDHLEEIDVTMKDIALRPDFEAITSCYIPNSAIDLIAVPLYLDCLLNAVDESAKQVGEEDGWEHSQSSEDLAKPYIELYGKRIIEYGNDILKNTISNINFDMELYKKCIGTFKLYGHPETLWKDVMVGARTSRLSEIQWLENRQSMESSKTITLSIFPRGLNVSLLEPLTAEAFRQRIELLSNEYDYNSTDVSHDKQEIYICFFNSREQFHEDCKMSVIPTKVCFRDYYRYVTKEIHQWTEQQEQIYEANNLVQTRLEKNFKSFNFEPITDKDFIFDPSIKRVIAEKLASESVQIKSTSQKSESKNSHKKSGSVLEAAKSSDDVVVRDETKADLRDKIALKTAYNIGDIRYQLNTIRSVFRTKGGVVRICKDKWSTGEMTLRTDLEYLGHHFLYNHTRPAVTDVPFMKIICKNSMIISYQICQSQLIQQTAEEMSGSELLTENSYYKVNITWPSGLEIKTVHNTDTGQILAIEQTSQIQNITLEKRIYYPNGMVLIFYPEGFVDVLTPSGTFYEGTVQNDVMRDSFSAYSSVDEPNIELYQNKYINEILQFEAITCDINKSKFKFTTPDGFVFETASGVVMRENQRHHLVEWDDFALGERYAAVEGGIKSVLVDNLLHVYFTNGTLITTATHDHTLQENCDNEENDSYDSIVMDENEPSAIAVTGNLIDTILADASYDPYVTCSRTYKIQHENYACIHFDKDEIKISCPDDTDIVFKEHQLQINVNNEFYVKCSADRCCILGQKYPDQYNSVKTVINLHSAVEPLLHITSGIDAELKVTQSGTRAYSFKSIGCPPKFINPPDKHIVLDKQLEGYELHSRLDVDRYVNCTQEPDCITYSHNEVITVLRRHRSFEDKFKMPIPELEQILKKFEKGGLHCEIIHRPTVDILNNIPDMMTIRTFISTRQHFQRKFPSIAEIYSHCSSFDDYVYSDSCESNVQKVLQMEAESALEDYLKQSKLIVPKTRLQRFSSAPSINITPVLNHISSIRKRLKVYKQMIRHDFFPKYDHFKMAGHDIRKLDISKYEATLNEMSGLMVEYEAMFFTSAKDSFVQAANEKAGKEKQAGKQAENQSIKLPERSFL